MKNIKLTDMIILAICTLILTVGIDVIKLNATVSTTISERKLDSIKELATADGQLPKTKTKAIPATTVSMKKDITLKDYEEKTLSEVEPFELGPISKAKFIDGEATTVNQANSESKPVEVANNGSGRPVTLAVTFYTDTAEENGGWAGMVSNNKKIAPGMVATGNNISYGTQLSIPNLGQYVAGLDGINNFVVEDRMHADEAKKCDDGEIRVDIYVPRLPGEDDDTYSARVNNYGRYDVQGYIS